MEQKMSRKRTIYTPAFKTKVVLEVLKGDKTLNQISQEYNIIPKNIINWKKQFLDNAEIAMEPAKAVKEYKDKIKELEKKVDKYAKTVGKITVERDWAVGKLKSLDLSTKREMVHIQAINNNKTVALSRQHILLGISRSYNYYEKVFNVQKEAIRQKIATISQDEFMCTYGEEKVYRQLLAEGYRVSLNTVSKYRREMGIKAILAVKPVSTTVSDDTHPKYPYRLKGINIDKPNRVWSTDITYIKIDGGMVYLAAIIDWYSKAVLSWKISNTMDTDLVMGVLDEALSKYPKPEIFNTDQGSQYTSYIHTQTLKDNDITISMDSKGRATDNIAIERFWRSAKVERIYLNDYNTIQELKRDISQYIEFYNYYRFHQTLNYKKPMEVYDKKRYKNRVREKNNLEASSQTLLKVA
jgi:putative transposase